MDIKAKIDEIVSKIKSDKNIASNFQKNPTGTVEKLIGVDLPDDQINKVVEGVKAKLDFDKIGGALGGLFGKK